MRPREESDDVFRHEEMVLSELVNRVLDRGVVVAGEVTISVGGIDLVHLVLQLRLSSTESLRVPRSARSPDALPPGGASRPGGR